MLGRMPADREMLEAEIAADVRAMNAESDQIGRLFASRHDVAANDFRALLYVMVAETEGRPLTAGELRKRMGMSGAAITYLVERMIVSGHFLRESDPKDRRKVILRVAEHGVSVARGSSRRWASRPAPRWPRCPTPTSSPHTARSARSSRPCAASAAGCRTALPPIDVAGARSGRRLAGWTPR